MKLGIRKLLFSFAMLLLMLMTTLGCGGPTLKDHVARSIRNSIAQEFEPFDGHQISRLTPSQYARFRKTLKLGEDQQLLDHLVAVQGENLEAIEFRNLVATSTGKRTNAVLVRIHDGPQRAILNADLAFFFDKTVVPEFSADSEGGSSGKPGTGVPGGGSGGGDKPPKGGDEDKPSTGTCHDKWVCVFDDDSPCFNGKREGVCKCVYEGSGMSCETGQKCEEKCEGKDDPDDPPEFQGSDWFDI